MGWARFCKSNSINKPDIFALLLVILAFKNVLLANVFHEKELSQRKEFLLIKNAKVSHLTLTEQE
jgi:hypothetical protein